MTTLQDRIVDTLQEFVDDGLLEESLAEELAEELLDTIRDHIASALA